MSSDSRIRERRLWIGTGAVVLAIYSTLGITRTVADLLRQWGLLEFTFVLGCLLIMVAVLFFRVRTRPGWPEVGVWLGVVAAYLLVFVRLSLPEERTHLVEYGVVGAFIHEALGERQRRGRRVKWAALLAIGSTAVLGTVDECLQGFFPQRHFDVRDILFNALAGTMAVGARVALGRSRMCRTSKR